MNLQDIKLWNKDSVIKLCQEIDFRNSTALGKQYDFTKEVANLQGRDDRQLGMCLLKIIRDLSVAVEDLHKKNVELTKKNLELQRLIAPDRLDAYRADIKAGRKKPAYNNNISNTEIKLLHDKGWSNARIAREFNSRGISVTAATIGNRLKKIEEENIDISKSLKLNL